MMKKIYALPLGHETRGAGGKIRRRPESTRVMNALRYFNSTFKPQARHETRRTVLQPQFAAPPTRWVGFAGRLGVSPAPAEPRPPVMGNMRKAAAPGGALALGFAAGFAVAQVVKVSKSAAHGMPYLEIWRKGLAETHGEIEAAMLAARMQARYEDLYAHRPSFGNKALTRHFEKHILPGIALYGVIHQEHRDRKSTLEDVDKLFAPAFTQGDKSVEMLRYVPRPFFLLRKIVQRRLKRDFPPEGWAIEVQEENDNVFDFRVRRCFYMSVLSAYGVPELTSLYCKNDDRLFAKLPHGIIWERTRTLGRGDTVCDFRWCNAANKTASNYELQFKNEPVRAAKV